MKKLQKIYYLFIWAILFAPAISFAWRPGQPIVPDCARVGSEIEGGCRFADVITLVNTLMSVFIWMAIPISTILFAWIGWDFIVNSSKPAAISSAKTRLSKLLWGMFFTLAPVILVKLILSGLQANVDISNFIK